MIWLWFRSLWCRWFGHKWESAMDPLPVGQAHVCVRCYAFVWVTTGGQE